jgi:hypothetical protein
MNVELAESDPEVLSCFSVMRHLRNLVALPEARSKGYGSALLVWLSERARSEGAQEFLPTDPWEQGKLPSSGKEQVSMQGIRLISGCVRARRAPDPGLRTCNPRLIGAARALGLICLTSLTGCDLGQFISGPPSSSCAESGVQCQLPSGPLGVCELSPCPSGAEPPCLTCTPQH